MILTDLSNAIKNLRERISFHKHFKREQYLLVSKVKARYNREKFIIYTRNRKGISLFLLEDS